MAAPLTLSVYARVRPFNETESRQDGSAGAHSWYSAIDVIDKRTLLFNPSRLKAIAPQTRFTTARRRLIYDQPFHFDGALGPDATQQDVYSDVAQPLLDTAMAGRNASIFAYGATGCGKSYTIRGILERLADDLFGRIELLRESTDISLTMTYVQLYQERLEDLLPAEACSEGGSKRSGVSLDLRDMNPDRPGEVRVPGLCEYHPRSASELASLCESGDRNRAVAATKANSVSSRSHAILSIHIEQQKGGSVTTSRLSIIDLAGSERAQSTNNRGARLAEGACINRSLLALGNVINACCSQQRHVPFRESKLTRLLRHSLTGDCHTAMIVCISPSCSHFDETRNTLEYGRRAAAITKRQPPVSARRVPRTISEIQVQAKRETLLELAERLSSAVPELELQQLSVDLKNRSTYSSASFADTLVKAINNLRSEPLPTGSLDAYNRRLQSPLRSPPPVEYLRVTSPLKRIRSTGKGDEVSTSQTVAESMARQNSKRIHV